MRSPLVLTLPFMLQALDSSAEAEMKLITTRMAEIVAPRRALI